MSDKTYSQLIGRTVGGCRVERRLGAGGMGVVFEAHHLALDKRVALKLLAPHLAADQSFVKRFVTEAQLAAQVEHPNIVQVLNVGQDGDVYFIVMQFIEGRSLAELLSGGPLAPRDAAKIVLQAARGLAAAHRRGIIHRDVKPENILIDSTGAARVVDMGLSKNLASPSNNSDTAALTAPGVAMGTPNYISPEQATEARAADARTDIYALGATFYHALVGAPPFSGPSAIAIINHHINTPLPPPSTRRPKVPPEFDRLIARMMAKRPEDRIQTMEEVADELRKFLTSGTGGATSAAAPAEEAAAKPAAPPPGPAPDASPRVVIGKDGIFVSSARGTVKVVSAGVEVARADGAVVVRKNKPGGKLKYVLLGALGMLGVLIFLGIVASAADPVRKAFVAAQDFERANPDAFDECRKRYEAARAINPSSKWSRQVAQALDSLQARQKSDAARAMSELKPQAEALEKSGDWAGAEKLWQAMSPRLPAAEGGKAAALRADRARVARRSAELFAALAEGGVEKAVPFFDPRKDQKAVRAGLGLLLFGIKLSKATPDGFRVEQVSLDAADRATLHVRFALNFGALKPPEEQEHEQSWQKTNGEWYVVENRRINEPAGRQPRPGEGRERPGHPPKTAPTERF